MCLYERRGMHREFVISIFQFNVIDISRLQYFYNYYTVSQKSSTLHLAP